MNRKIKLVVWGITGPDAEKHTAQATGYAIRREDETPADAVMRTIARRTGLAWATRARCDCEVQEAGRVVATHYSATLGRWPTLAGFTPVTQVWFSVPAGGAP